MKARMASLRRDSARRSTVDASRMMTRWARRAVPADRQKSIGEAEALFLTNASPPLAKGDRDRGFHALASQL